MKLQILVVFLALLTGVSGCVQQEVPQPAAPAPLLSVQALSSVPGEIILIVSVEHFDLIPPESAPARDGEGHLHVWIDDDTENKQITDQTTIMFGNLPAGLHTATVELVASNHSSFSPPITRTISFTVEIPETPSLRMTAPADGETIVGYEITVMADVENIQLVPPQDERVAGQGHIHYFLDDQYTPSSDTTIVFENVSAGSHTLRAELHHNDHSLLEPPVTDTITITVQEPLPEVTEFHLAADEQGYYLGGEEITTLEMPEGESVRIVFSFNDENIYFGGLDIKSDHFSTVSYKKGSGETKTVEFTADKDFTIRSYWPATSRLKATLDIVVT